MSDIAQGMFEIEMTPGAPEADGEVNRFDFTKTFTGDLAATGVGVMLSCGDPQSGAAGYVAIETVRGRLGGVQGGFALQQFGQMHNGSQTLTYQVVPGSGVGALVGIVGALELTIDEDGTHHYTLTYDL
jgi:hypothetical protein